MRNLDYPLESSYRFVVDFVSSKQVGVVAEITQEPAELPEGFGGAVEPRCYVSAGKLSRFEYGQVFAVS